MLRAKKDQFYYGWTVVAACLFIGVVGFGIRYSYGVFFKSLEQDFGWSRALTSGIFSGYMVSSCVLGIPGGWALDRYGPKIVVLLMGFFTVLGLLLTGQASSLWHLFIGYSLLLAIGTGQIYIVTMAAALRWFTRHRGQALAIISAGAGLGIIVMTPIAAYLVSSYGWQTAYFIMALVALFIMVPCALLLRQAPATAAVLLDRGELTATVTEPPLKQSRDELQDYSLLQAAKSKNFWWLFVGMLLHSLCAHLVVTHLIPHAIDLGISPMKAATILTVLGGASILGRLLMGTVSDRIGRKQAAIISAMFMAGAMLLLIGARNLWMLYLFGVIFGLSWGGIDPTTTVLIGDVFGTRHIGVIFGALSIGYSVGAAIGPTLAGYIFDVSGNYVLAFLIGAVAMLITAVLIFLVTRPGQQPLPVSGH